MKGLDKWLTTPPDDGFDNWCEDVLNYIDDEFYNQNEDWLIDSNLCNKWLNKLFDSGKSYKQASSIIKRAFKIIVANEN